MTTEPSSQQALSQAIEQTLHQAIAHHQAGQLQEAEMLYRAILKIHPNHPDTNHNMGILSVQRNLPAEGLPYFTAALEADPTLAQYWLSYIDALIQSGHPEDALQVLALAHQQGLQGEEVDALAIRLNGVARISALTDSEPQDAIKVSQPVPAIVAHNDKNGSATKPNGVAVRKPDKSNGKSSPHKNNPSPKEINALVALFTKARYTEAETLARRMMEQFPFHGFAWRVLGSMYKQMGKYAEALAPMQKAAALSPNDFEVHNDLGVILKVLGRLDEAEVCYRRALQLKPNIAELHSNLGNILRGLDRLDEAEASYRRALQLKPDYAEAYSNLGNTLKGLERLAEAEASLRRALQLKPDYAEAYSNLGIVLQNMGRMDEAEASYRRALQLKPGIAEIHNNLGKILLHQGRLDEAEAMLRQSLQINPDSSDSHNNLGIVLLNQGRLDEADTSYRQALQFKPDYAIAYSNMLFCLSNNEGWDVQALLAEHLNFGEQFEAQHRAAWPQHGNSRDSARRLQVGFVSGDFYYHAVASFIEPVLVKLAGYTQLSLHAYYNNIIDDQVTQRLRGYFAHWHVITALSDAELAEKIREDGIDILIDLSGHTASNRLLTFARKPAPVQASWVGYPGTSGLSAMDYYLSDRFALPSGQFDDQFTEKIVRLPAGAPFLPSKEAPPVNTLPALSNGYVTFGSFNRVSKLGRSVIALWSQLLRALPNSRILLGGMPEEGKYNMLIEWFAQEGIARERLEFHSRSNMDRYLLLHHQVDICLDTFPYNGGTTTLHAIWMGVPTISLSGHTVASRTGGSILRHAGLEAFVASDESDFVQKGLYWAGNLITLSEIRSVLRERFAQSAMGQPEIVAAGLERALRIMWQRWCAGLPAESFEVARQEIIAAELEGGK